VAGDIVVEKVTRSVRPLHYFVTEHLAKAVGATALKRNQVAAEARATP